jgi:hypothetical protein
MAETRDEVESKATRFISLVLNEGLAGGSGTTENSENSEASEASENSEDSEKSEDKEGGKQESSENSESSEATETSESSEDSETTENAENDGALLRTIVAIDPSPDEWGLILRIVDVFDLSNRLRSERIT